MSKKHTSLTKKMAVASTVFILGTSPAFAANEGRSLADFGRSIKELVTIGTDLSYSIILLVGLILVAGGIIAWALASKTHNQQTTRGYAGTAFVAGILLCSIMGVINMGSNTGTGQASELEAFYQSSQSSSTNN
ncbi:hypothetical protein KW429_11165 [Vibrio fluvialis]|nr:hypothetical protein [Vibrio fluvialis]MBY7902412.1 hypothetical protein [Vibrio fluvialis]